jgi:metallo-beta-lactamase family protein
VTEISYPTITHHGAATGVTGSCHELAVGDSASVLIDCGLFQGDEARERRQSPVEGLNDDSLAIDFSIDRVRALVLTHVHIDHCGRIPWLLAAGFRGPIYCSEPSARLLPLMLEDAFKVGISRDRRLVEAYLDTVRARVVSVPYKTWQTVIDEPDGSLAVRFVQAGHILGSAYVQCKARSRRLRTSRILFSGDLGAPYAPILPAPRSPYGTDILVTESTYGDRLHQGRRDRRRSLETVIRACLANRGTVLVPAFSLGRTQELLYELEDVIYDNRGTFARDGLPWDELEVVLDSPLAGRITQAFRDLKPYWDAEAKRRVARGRKPLTFDQLTPVDSHSSHLHTVDYLKRTGRPTIVISASGMCTGGRIVNYIKELIGDPRTDILFIGYQARGTPGWAIQTYGPRGGWVDLDGKRHTIRAGVHSISGYSAHADQRNLVNFARRMRKKPRQIRLVHGDKEAKQALAGELAKELPQAEILISS